MKDNQNSGCFGSGDQKSAVGCQSSEDRRQKTEDGEQKSVVSCQLSVIRTVSAHGVQKTEDGRQRTEKLGAQARRLKTTKTTVDWAAVVRGQKSVIRGQKNWRASHGD